MTSFRNNIISLWRHFSLRSYEKPRTFSPLSAHFFSSVRAFFLSIRPSAPPMTLDSCPMTLDQRQLSPLFAPWTSHLAPRKSHLAPISRLLDFTRRLLDFFRRLLDFMRSSAQTLRYLRYPLRMQNEGKTYNGFCQLRVVSYFCIKIVQKLCRFSFFNPIILVISK